MREIAASGVSVGCMVGKALGHSVVGDSMGQAVVGCKINHVDGSCVRRIFMCSFSF